MTMNAEHTPNNLSYQRYLRLLGLSPQPPDLPFLAALTAAHLDCIPFENVSKLLYFRRDGFRGIVPLERYLDGIEHLHFGGTCYANASHFQALLLHLGFDARLCGADMSRPDVHAVNIVTIDSREYLVDVGYGAPLATPFPLDTEVDLTVEFADDCYLLHPRNSDRTSRLDHLRHGSLIHGYTVKPAPRTPGFFTPVSIESFRPEAEFMNTITLARYSARESVIIRPHLMLRQAGRTLIRQRISSSGSLYQLIAEYFHIPGALIADSLDSMDLSYDR